MGIATFRRLIERGERTGLLERLEEMERRYRLNCLECGHRFWVESELIETSAWDGSLKGFRCPGKDCEAVVPWRKQ